MAVGISSNVASRVVSQVAPSRDELQCTKRAELVFKRWLATERQPITCSTPVLELKCTSRSLQQIICTYLQRLDLCIFFNDIIGCLQSSFLLPPSPQRMVATILRLCAISRNSRR